MDYESEEEIPVDIIEESVRMAQASAMSTYRQTESEESQTPVHPGMMSQEASQPSIKEDTLAPKEEEEKKASYLSMSGEKDCSVCCESYSRSRYAIDCLYCGYHSCVKCTKYYILNTAQEAHCMSCKKKWNRAFLGGVLPEKFIFTEYKEHRENMLLEREKAYLPATQAIIPPLRTKRALNRMKDMVCLRIDAIGHGYRDKEEYRTKRDLLENQEWLKRLIDEKILDCDIHYNQLIGGKAKEKAEFIMKCPSGSCRGFLSSKYKCGVCNAKFCSHCHENLSGTIQDSDQGDIKEEDQGDIKEEDQGDSKEEETGVVAREETEKKAEKHKCDPNTVESVKEIKKSTRNCPNCHVAIFKSSGCDQMWCVQCHTAFNWRTGQIEKGVIHNPEYFEFIRKSGMTVRNPYEQVCGGIPDLNTLLGKYGRHRSNADALVRFYRLTTHHRHTTLQNLPTALDNVNNQDLRIEYLMNQISEDDFKIKLQRRQKEREHRLEYRQSIDTFVTVMEELIRQLNDGAITLEVFYKQAQTLKQVTDSSIRTICNLYKVKYNSIESI
jgi:hypothetical protein